MEIKTINELTPSGISSDNDAMIFQSAGGVTHKILWSSVAGRIINDHIAQGQNVTLSRSGNVLTISADSAEDGYSVSAAVSVISGGHRVTISSTDPNAEDVVFDVMDGVSPVIVNTYAVLNASGWTGTQAPYTQAVTVSGITAGSEPVLDVSVSDTTATGTEQIKQWGYISKAVTAADTITFSCYETKPDIDLTVKIKVV